ncbi:sensor histidine kinase [Cellulosilyticum sp. I15G10I2]|uniref:sensor histidine kinase n=1 Tax=Cellulosilyticum sp. I15G10I2 TaxID=1892843 RepID=UPI001A9A56C3|nr:HAMP domain-containing sensor histidine kinase [Cellulosilyticum sp. I15G10I2]
MFNSLAGLGSIPKEKSWYESASFMNQLTYKTGFVRDWIVRYKDEAIFSPSSIEEEQIKAYKANNDKIKNDEQAIETIIKDRQAYFKRIEQELIKDNINVEYLGINLTTGEVVTNIARYNSNNQKEVIEELIKRPGFVWANGSTILKTHKTPYGNEGYFYYNYNQNFYTGEPFEGDEDFEIYVAVTEEVKEGDWFYKDKQEFDKRSLIRDKVYGAGIIGVLLALILLVYWIKIIGQREKGGPITIRLFDKIPFEIQFIIYGLGMLIWVAGSARILREIVPHSWLPYTFDPSSLGVEIGIFLLVSIGVFINILFASSLIKHIKNHTMHQYIGVVRVTRWLVKTLVKEKTLPLAAVLIVGAYFFINFMFVFIMLVFGSRIIVLPGMVLMLGFNVAAALALLKIVLDYLKLFRGSKQIAQGNIKTKIELNYALPVMNDMAHIINHIGEGLERAVEDSLKSERLKTELITNVSHDLKTPLTSIISYIDLLKEEPMENTAAKEYIQVLDERSNRLKQLVEDLVDASKAVTGNVKANLAPLELNQLARQAIGEYTDRLEANGLMIVMNRMEEVRILADGRHMYRIIENLLSNVNKYAMPHTRVYIDILQENGYGVFVIKNISKEYLNIDPSELTKRFVRGDKSRSTEGSGLGLAIAESLVKLQNGLFHNSIDGDLFKVEVKIPIC